MTLQRLLKNLELNNKKRFTFLVAGRLIYRKGHMLLLDALSCLPDDLDYECRIVGDGPEMSALKEKYLSNPKLQDHVVFTGKIPYVEMESEYKNADAFIMPSIRETTGTVLLESMAKGIPVITINKFGGPVLFDKESGWLYDGNDKSSYIEGLKNAIQECIENPEEVKRRGQNARKKAEQYVWEKKDQYYQKIYRELIER